MAAGAVLSAALAACATAPPKGSAGEPAPIVVKTLGKSDGKYGRTDDEARRLAGVRDVWRQGDLLTVDTREGIQYRLVDAGMCEGFDTCRRWIFRGTARALAVMPESHLVDYRLIEFEQGEGGYWLAVNVGSGTSTVLDTEPRISPDSRRWATGECNELSGSSLKILDSDNFGQMVPKAIAPDDVDCCQVLGWDGPALKVKSCDLEPGKAYEDRLVRQADGRWAGKRIRLQKPEGP